MTIYKKGTHNSPVTVASSVYSCTKCDYTEMASGSNKPKKCPVCEADMIEISGADKEEDTDKE